MARRITLRFASGSSDTEAMSIPTPTRSLVFLASLSLVACVDSGPGQKVSVQLRIRDGALSTTGVRPSLPENYCYALHLSGDHPTLKRGPTSSPEERSCGSAAAPTPSPSPSSTPSRPTYLQAPKQLGLVKGFYRKGSEATLEIPTGSARRVDLIGVPMAEIGNATCAGVLAVDPVTKSNGKPGVSMTLDGRAIGDKTLRIFATGSFDVGAETRQVELDVTNPDGGGLVYGCPSNDPPFPVPTPSPTSPSMGVLNYPHSAIKLILGQGPMMDTPILTGHPGGATYAVTPALPAGLSLSASSGMIQGTPTAVQAPQTYVVQATSSAGSTFANLTIETLNPPTYAGGPFYTNATQTVVNLNGSCQGNSGTLMITGGDGVVTATCSGGAWSRSVPKTGADGNYSLTIEFVSLQGRQFWLPSTVITRDTVAQTLSGTVSLASAYTRFPSMSPTATFVGSVSNDASGTARHEIAIRNASNSSIVVAWKGIGVAVAHSESGLSLSAGVAYQSGFRSVDGAGNVSNEIWSTSWQLDTIPPSAPSGINVIREIDNLKDFEALWTSSSDAGSGVAHYEYSVETSAGAQDVRPWTPTYNPLSTIANGALALNLATSYILNVRGVDAAGNVGPPSSTNFATWAGGNWSMTSTANAPTARTNLGPALWTGTEFLVWGGYDGSSAVDTGARYNPTTDAWTAMTTSGAPSARYDYAAVWQNGKAWYFGGSTCTGQIGKYDPTGNAWYTQNFSPTKTLCKTRAATVGGTDIYLWGGLSPLSDADLLRVAAATSTTSVVSTSGTPPSGRQHHSLTAVGTRLVVWGGHDGTNWQNTGAVVDTTTGVWTPMTTSGAPSARGYHEAVAIDGDRVLVWGGWQGNAGTNLASGAIYRLSTDQWTPLPAAPLNGRLSYAHAFANGRFVVWGGDTQNSQILGDGASYNPASNTWAPLAFGSLSPRRLTAYGTDGNRLFIWGGDSFPTFHNSGAVFQP